MRTIWLASYPKSGNTWFRLLVANLRRETPADINAIPPQASMASARAAFDATMLFPSGLLTHEECDRLRPCLHAALAQDGAADDTAAASIDGVRLVKTHDAWTYTTRGEPLLGGKEGAAGAILLVRDPRAVTPSLANHTERDLNTAITFLADPEACFCAPRDRQLPQLRQQLSSWSGFNASWLGQDFVPLHVVRYEDLATDTAATLARALAFAGIAASAAQCERAARFADFDALKAQEAMSGFREAPRRSGPFFRSGTAEGWRTTLSPEQAQRIAHDHATMMARLGYLPDWKERLAG